MPSYATQRDAGGGVFRCRLVIAGWPHVFVSDASLELTESDGRVRLNGLDPVGLRISARADLARAMLREQEQSFEIIDNDAHTVTASLGAKPTAKTWLTSSLSKSGTTVNVSSTAGFASSGVIHVHTEAIAYSSKTATTFTGLTRGHWDTIAQAHDGPDGDRLPGSAVTDLPRTLRGRKVKVYLYGAGDAASGTGTLRWQGGARTDRSYQAGTWSFAASPLSSRLDQSIGGDLEEPAGISGIYLPASSCLSLGLQRWDGAGLGGSSDVTSDFVFVRLSGRWIDNEAFCSDLDAAITTATAGWGWGAGSTIRAESLGPSGWRLVYETSSPTRADFVSVTGVSLAGVGAVGVSPVDYFATASDAGIGAWLDPSGEATLTLNDGAIYTMDFIAPVPRGVVGVPEDVAAFGTAFVDPEHPEHTADRVYVGGRVALSTSMYAVIRPDGEEGDDEILAPVSAVSATERYVQIPGSAPGLLGPKTRVRLARELATNQHVDGLITTLAVSSPSLANAGAMPLLELTDFDFDFGAIEDATADLRMTRRTWITQEGISLRELLEHELRLIGCYLSVRSTGALTVRRLRAPTATDVEGARITPKNTTRSLPGITFCPDGTLKEVLYRQGWNWTTGEHDGLTIRARNAETADPSVLGGSLEVAPRSRGTTTGDFGLEIDPEHAYSLASTVLGLFGGAYRVASFGVTMGLGEGTTALIDAEVGKTVLVTSPFLPDADGTMGLSLRPGILIGYDWSPFEGEGTIEVLFTDLDVAGYAPELPIASESNTGGNTWALTVTTSGFVPSGTGADDWFSPGDEVQAIERGTTAQSTSTVPELTGGGGAAVSLTSPVAFTVGPGGYLGARAFTGTVGGATTTAGSAAMWAALKSDCTITAWVRPNVIGAYQVIGSFYGGPTDSEADNILAQFGISPAGKMWLFFEHSTGTNVNLISTGTTMEAGRWYRLDFVRDSGSATIDMYLDGVLDDTFSSQPDATGGTTAYGVAIAQNNGGSQILDGDAYGLTLRDVIKSGASIAAEVAAGPLYEPDGDTIGMWLRHAPDVLTGDVSAATATTVTVDFDATASALGSGDWILSYPPSSVAEEVPNAPARWPQSAFAFVADSTRRITRPSGDVDAVDFAP